MKTRLCLSSVSAMLLLAACGQPQQAETPAAQEPQQQVTGQLPAGHPQLAAVTQDSISQGALIGGVVEEVLAGGGYTYVKVTVDGKEQWAAAPMTSVSVGQKVAWETNAPMTNFRSSSLNRTFETVYFVSHFNTPGMMNQAAAQPHGADHAQPHGANHAQAAAPAGVSTAEVLEVFASAGYSYLRVNEGGQEKWLAVPETQVAQGTMISWNGGSEMNNFTSRSLNRTFDSIWFIDHIQVN
ncbi:hypothetical protein [Shewanella sedimentimangrovi]|uniref:SH3b domain-containing protein n=1 Tax=Shewanella sedimentimangrovi TaxID=2814293 RepID=A0ABX7R351_9GAMM|nr:hypothetical protein [Shewanella sedimentimangrovi]QSX37717.1 hypothetical protein JYB85_02420 [Shewanella sedimentimangrovi]